MRHSPWSKPPVLFQDAPGVVLDLAERDSLEAAGALQPQGEAANPAK